MSPSDPPKSPRPSPAVSQIANPASAADPIAGIAVGLPRLRRHARALTGSQQAGDGLAIRALEALVAAPAEAARPLALFVAFHKVWAEAGNPAGAAAGNPLEARTQALLEGLTPLAREALLLHALEGFRASEIADILGILPEEVAPLIETARAEMGRAVTGRVLVIEDEAIIAMDIAAIVGELGHGVTGIARTHAEAVALAARERPDLILADINLADHSSGIEAVNEILARAGIAPEHLPVVFITAYPERLLTGERPEPAFLITKPYAEEQLRSAVGQAMFFASTRTLV